MSTKPAASDSPVILDASDEAEIFWAQHKTKIISGAVILVVGVALFAIFQITTLQQQVAAAQAFASATTPEALQKVATDYPKSPVAGNARILVAEKLLAEGKQDEAIAEYKKFVTEQPEHPFVPSAWIGIGSILDTQGKSDDAIAAYQKVAGGSSYAAPYAMFAEAKLRARVGKESEATALFKQLAVKYPASQFANAADQEREMLGE